ncbi:YHYH protein [Octadecabacter sp. G9-8]|uniref:YHYH protein n=1 Tax=Octadecabacter dasysiphoniae TaxID=2909341 RepID=A0ABS9D187_9RHOB|nr:YHYH protein [Octadecabacter dasysiphoniae]MCF2872966.1 YHYH protein [Octadecabacter dasysiphoniae]
MSGLLRYQPAALQYFDGNLVLKRLKINVNSNRVLMTNLQTAAFMLAATVTATTAVAHENIASTEIQGDMTCISSNGAPDHDMGEFPNRANPNAFLEQNLTFCFATSPQLADTVTTDLMTVGVSTTGVPIRPYTAGYYDPNGRRGFSQDPSSGWRQQAMHDPSSLGMDDQNAHVDRAGLYHYHAVPSALLASQGGSLIGYAPDGFEIRYSPSSATSSWQLKDGVRPTPPGEDYDGTFEEDFEFTAGSGTLDECNGGMIDGTYTYFATDTYPYYPRCFKGVVNPQFMMRN